MTSNQIKDICVCIHMYIYIYKTDAVDLFIVCTMIIFSFKR